LPLWKLGAWFLLLSIGATLALDTVSRARQLVRTNLSDRGFDPSAPSDTTSANQRMSIKQALRRGNFGRAYALIQEQTAAQRARTDAKAQTIEKLVKLYDLPTAEKRVTLLYIPKTNRVYWDLFGADPRDRGRPPWATPFVAPALSGLALLDGLPDPQDLPPGGEYGYGVYARAKETGRPSDQHKEELGRRAAEMGFRRILVLDAGPGGEPLLHEW